MSAATELRACGYTTRAASMVLAGTKHCMHMGPVTDKQGETVCVDCDERFASMIHLARAGGWNILTRGWAS